MWEESRVKKTPGFLSSDPTVSAVATSITVTTISSFITLNYIIALYISTIYHLPSSSKSAYVSLLYLVCLRFFCLRQPLLLMRSRGEPLSSTVKVVTALAL